MNHADSRVDLDIDPTGQIRLSGVLDFYTVPVVWEQHQAQMAGLPVWEIDLAGIERSNSAGLALLISWLREGRQQDRPVRLLNIPEQMLQIARVSELEDILSYESV